jgi:hypothetical protein
MGRLCFGTHAVPWFWRNHAFKIVCLNPLVSPAFWSVTLWSHPTRAPHIRYQAAICCALACMENTMNFEGRVMSDAGCNAFKKAYVVYRCALNWLAQASLEACKCRYRLRPKVHQPAHIVHSYLPLNPRKYSNYLDEDFIFKTKKVAEKAHPLYMPTHVMMRYSIHACLRWWDGPF